MRLFACGGRKLNRLPQFWQLGKSIIVAESIHYDSRREMNLRINH